MKKDFNRNFPFFFEQTSTFIIGMCDDFNLSEDDTQDVLKSTYLEFWKKQGSLEKDYSVLGLLRTIVKDLIQEKTGGSSV